MPTASSSQIEGIVIRAYPSGESDLVLRVICRGEGKLSFLAKHARQSKRRFGSRLDLFDRGTFEVRMGKGSLPLVERFTPSKGLKNLREDLARLTVASVICEGFDFLLLEGAADDDQVFDLLNSSLSKLDESRTLKESLRICHEALGRLLSLAGYFDEGQIPAASAKNLLALLGHLERCAEKELQSKPVLVGLIDSLRTPE